MFEEHLQCEARNKNGGGRCQREATKVVATYHVCNDHIEWARWQEYITP